MYRKQAAELFKDLEKIQKKYSLSYNEILGILERKENLAIPISIFSKKLGSLESIVKFLKENLGLSLKEISFLTGRKIQPIRTTYNRAARKSPRKLGIISEESIPLSILQNKALSVLESLVCYLLESDYHIADISSILKRDYKTIWTIKDRLEKKR